MCRSWTCNPTGWVSQTFFVLLVGVIQGFGFSIKQHCLPVDFVTERDASWAFWDSYGWDNRRGTSDEDRWFAQLHAEQTGLDSVGKSRKTIYSQR